LIQKHRLFHCTDDNRPEFDCAAAESSKALRLRAITAQLTDRQSTMV
jgi:hypothetical protein